MQEVVSPTISDCFAEWVSQPEILARFFNTLSYLEHLGSRKILSCNISFTEEHLRHATEETRHALRFKRMVRVLVKDTFEDYTLPSLLGGHAAYFYFQKLDATVRQYLKNRDEKDAMLNYLLVTYIVEMRAAQLYPEVQRLLEEHNIPVSVKGIINEEDRHLTEIGEGLAARGISLPEIDPLIKDEEMYYDRFLASVMKEARDIKDTI